MPPYGAPLSLGGPVRDGLRSDPRDVLALKRALGAAGYYRPNPGAPFDGTLDRPLDAGLRRFQHDHGLMVDSLAASGGETEAALNAALSLAGSGGSGSSPAARTAMALAPSDDHAVHEALTSWGYPYVPDSFGRLGRGEAPAHVVWPETHRTPRGYLRWRLTGTTDPAEADARMKVLSGGKFPLNGETDGMNATTTTTQQTVIANPLEAIETKDGDLIQIDSKTNSGNADARTINLALSAEQSNIVDTDKALSELNFEQNGPKEGNLPWDVQAQALFYAQGAQYDTRERFEGQSETGRNDAADAYRHALWTFRMTRALGPDVAKTVGDAHERSVPNPDEELLMDLYNNKVGRELAMDPENADKSAEEIARQALERGLLRTRPFRSERQGDRETR
jgi:hypothetical protein